jgi:5-methylcytosine-specific restriction endonuclease McrA
MITEAVRELVWNKTDGKCWYCGIELIRYIKYLVGTRNPNLACFTIDHVMPKVQGGDDSLSNLVSSCWGCNCEKKVKNLEEYRWLKTRLLNNIPRFNKEQLKYLQCQGVSIEVPKWHIFYFEKEGLHERSYNGVNI